MCTCWFTCSRWIHTSINLYGQWPRCDDCHLPCLGQPFTMAAQLKSGLNGKEHGREQKGGAGKKKQAPKREKYVQGKCLERQLTKNCWGVHKPIWATVLHHIVIVQWCECLPCANVHTIVLDHMPITSNKLSSISWGWNSRLLGLPQGVEPEAYLKMFRSTRASYLIALTRSVKSCPSICVACVAWGEGSGRGVGAHT